LLRRVGTFPVNRRDADFAAVRKAYQLLKEGKVVGLFPEGTRSKTGALQKAYNGAALIAVRSGTPILPLAIVGPYRFLQPIKVYIGPLFELPPLNCEHKADKKLKLEQMSALIMENIGKLFPANEN
ncbi:MAG TPA: lysophospholipid acyltransferase family protein, partial [Candidatus Limnocylindrales bacterium]|nr:lysophospholipid acyltransferase family protein [Candidatus Limnocylindrales bacterium]